MYSIPLSGSYFHTPGVTQSDTICYALPYRVFLGVGQSACAYRYIANGTLHQSPLQSHIPNCTIFVPHPEITDQTMIQTLIRYFEYANSPDIHAIGVTDMGFIAHHCLPLVEKTTPIHIRTNKHFTTIDGTTQRVKQHCLISYPGKNYKTTNTIDFINTQPITDRWKEGSTNSLIKALQTYRFTTIKDITLLNQIVHLEQEINTSYNTDNEIILMPNKKTLSVLNFSEVIITQINSDYALLYNSIEQGYAQAGYRCEQRLSKGIIHEYSPKTVTLKTSRSGTQLVDGTYESVKQGAEILLDGVSNKVIINGHTFDSSHLPSQKATIEILGKLIETYGETTNNTDFPASSYVKNKNTLVGKIIAPLNKLLKTHGKPEIKRSVQGSLYSFDLTLPKQHISVTYIKKLY